MAPEEQVSGLRLIASALLWCFVVSYALLIVWFCIFICPMLRGWAHSIHSLWIELSPREFALLNYYGMGFLKLCIFVLFLCPCIGLRVAIWKARRELGI